MESENNCLEGTFRGHPDQPPVQSWLESAQSPVWSSSESFSGKEIPQLLSNDLLHLTTLDVRCDTYTFQVKRMWGGY